MKRLAGCYKHFLVKEASKRQRCDRGREQSKSQGVSFKDKRDMMRMIKNRVHDRVKESLCARTRGMTMKESAMRTRETSDG